MFEMKKWNEQKLEEQLALPQTSLASTARASLGGLGLESVWGTGVKPFWAADIPFKLQIQMRVNFMLM